MAAYDPNNRKALIAMGLLLIALPILLYFAFFVDKGRALQPKGTTDLTAGTSTAATSAQATGASSTTTAKATTAAATSLASTAAATAASTVASTTAAATSTATAAASTASTTAPSQAPTTAPTATPTSPPTSAAGDLTRRAQAILAKMTLAEKVGQMFLARCPESGAQALLEQYQLGGYILFARDFAGKDKAGVRAMTAAYQSVSKIPIFLGADEEGGTVNRISLNPRLRAVPFWAPQDLYAEGGWPLIQHDTKEKCELLEDLGLNLNMAPVCDVSTNPQDFIYRRSFGRPAKETADYVRTVVTVMREQGLGSVLKHFPGYGNNRDTHTGIAYDKRPYEQFVQSDFLPFKAGIAAGASMVLVAHNIVESIDPNYPASLSPKVHAILREQLGFDGLIMTDDLSMDGIRDFTGAKEAAVLAVEAGNDLLCCSDFTSQIPAVLAAVQNGQISEARIDQSVLRILRCKLALGILR